MSKINSSVNRVYPVDYMFKKVEELTNLLEGEVVTTKEKVDAHDSLLAEKAKQTDLTTLQNQVNGISASPKGTYAALTDLQTAFPSGTTGVYIVSADGGWYYWNGSAWTKGGTYQSTGIAAGSIIEAYYGAGSILNTHLKYPGKSKYKGIDFPLRATSRGGITTATTSNDRNFILDVKVYGATKNKIYQIGWYGKTALISSVAYSGIELVEYNSDFSGSVTLISYTHPMNLNAPTSGVETRKYFLDNGMMCEVTVDWAALSDNRQITIRTTGVIIDESNYVPYPTIPDFPDVDNIPTPLRYYQPTGSTLSRIAFKYNETQDMWIDFHIRGQNSAYCLSEFWLLPNTTEQVSSSITTTSSATSLLRVYSDWIGPYQVSVVNNKDGGNVSASTNFTGGWHGYNGDLNGAATATVQSKKWLVDGIVPQQGIVYKANHIQIVVVNLVQSFETIKSDGSGRACIKETVTYDIYRTGRIEVTIEIEALEDIVIKDYMGIQAQVITNWDERIFFDDDSNLKWNTVSGVGINAGSRSTGSQCNSIIANRGTNYLQCEVDGTFSLGRRKIPDTERLAYYNTVGKVYFSTIKQDFTMTANQIVKLKGAYNFYSR